MKEFVQKTFSDSYIYNLDINGNRNIAKEINSKLIEYITKSDRIENKKDTAFSGIREEVKRQQTSSLLYSILMSDNIVLCINNIEMPRAFKVFEAKDIAKDGKRRVFIDVTGLIKLENGYYVCKTPYVLITYLMNSIGYLLYRNEPEKLLSNSNITISATECYVNCFVYILDYLRIVGYSENRDKIKYLVGLYFLRNFMNKDLDTYSKNVAAKIANIGTKEINAYELYYDAEKDFKDISTFIQMIVTNFKLKDLTVEVFIQRWVYHFWRGTEYAIDLLTSFLSMITSAYCGTYIVSQKQIEKCCGKSMVKLVTSLVSLGASTLDKSMYYSESELAVHDRQTIELAEALAMRKSLPEYAKINKDDFKSKDIVKTKVKNLIKYYIASKQEDKISSKLTNACISAMKSMDRTKVTTNYESGVLESIISEGKKYFNDKDKRNIISKIDSTIGELTDLMKKDNIRVNKDLVKKIGIELSELRKSEGKIV